MKDILENNNGDIIKIFRGHLSIYNILALNEYIDLSKSEDLKKEVKEWVINNVSTILRSGIYFHYFFLIYRKHVIHQYEDH